MKFKTIGNIASGFASFPTRERGLKSEFTWMYHADVVVPHEGTWIEIDLFTALQKIVESFPTRERGLKSLHSPQSVEVLQSFPTRERGLKYVTAREIDFVTSRSPRGNVD